jgi:serine/threonine protein kinase
MNAAEAEQHRLKQTRGAPEEAGMADRVGQRLGNYRLVRLIGKGGFAEVYLGEHLRLNTPAALKVLHTRLASAEEIESFQQEAQTIARLVHPHIVRVLDFDVEDDTPFLVMDYAPNGTLRQKHPRGTRLAPDVILPYVKQAAEALHYAHERKLIHRDIKPENLLLGEHDAILLSDFGIALIAQSSRYQNTQEVVGTMAYMAPEQLQGHPRPASDQYSLAITAYEWLTGDRPFHGSYSEVFSQQMFVAPAPLREKLPTIAPALEEVVLTALAKDPKERFGSVRAFANAFEQACQDAALHFAPTQVIPPSGPIARPTAAITPATPPVSGPQPAPNLPPPIAVPPSRAPAAPARPIPAAPGATPVTSTPPGWRDIPAPAPAPPTPMTGTLLPSMPGPAAGISVPPVKETVRPKRRGRPLVITVSLILILAVIAGGIVALTYFNSFHQEVTTGPDITSIQVGTGIDPSSGIVQGQTDTFHSGDTVYLTFSIANQDASREILSALDDKLFYNKSLYYVGATSPTEVATIFVDSEIVRNTGPYKWEVDYNGDPEASITFQVV